MQRPVVGGRREPRVPIGNCAEHEAVAVDYLLGHTRAEEEAAVTVCDDHILPVIGADRFQLFGAASGVNRLSSIRLPDRPAAAVVRDPRDHEWLPTAQRPTKIRAIPAATGRSPIDRDVEVAVDGFRRPGTLAEYRRHVEAAGRADQA